LKAREEGKMSLTDKLRGSKIVWPMEIQKSAKVFYMIYDGSVYRICNRIPRLTHIDDIGVFCQSKGGWNDLTETVVTFGTDTGMRIDKIDWYGVDALNKAHGVGLIESSMNLGFIHEARPRRESDRAMNSLMSLSCYGGPACPSAPRMPAGKLILACRARSI